MAKNTTCEVIDFQTIKKDPFYYATLFSEGNTALKDLLSYCYLHNIQTVATCIGHSTHGNCYIYFAIDLEQINYFKAIIMDVKSRYFSSYEIRNKINFPGFDEKIGIILRTRRVDASRFFHSIYTDLKYHDELKKYQDIDDFLFLRNYLNELKLNTSALSLVDEDKKLIITIFDKYFYYRGYNFKLDHIKKDFSELLNAENLSDLEGKFVYDYNQLQVFNEQVLKKIMK